MIDHTNSVECSTCGHIWMAQWPAGTRKLECPICHQFTDLKPSAALSAEILKIFVGMAKEAGYVSPSVLHEDISVAWEFVSPVLKQEDG